MTKNNLLVILGNQLFPIEKINKIGCKTIFMKEDLSLTTDYLHHKLKILMFFIAMREYRDELIDNGYQVIYHSIDDHTFTSPFMEVLHKTLLKHKITTIDL